jgi:ankyrin repeat protein
MDAQNAVGPASTKPPAASLKRPGSDADQHHEATTTNKSPKISRRLSISKEARLHPPLNQEDAGQDGNSDAETIVLPGKDGLHSPSKVRKIKKEESEAGDRADHPTQRKHLTSSKHDRDGDRKDRDRGDRVDKPPVRSSSNGPSEVKRKKLLDRPDKPRSKDGSSGLSSAPASPPPQRRRRLSKAQSESGSEHARGIPSMKPAMSERTHLPDKLVPHKRKASKAESDDEAENRKVRRQRISGSGLSASRNRDAKPPPKLHSDSHTAPRNRSASPPARPHRRSISTQLPAQSANGLGQKKKRIPAPLQSTEYHSDESSASGSPHPRSSKLRSLTTPATAESAMSPAKMAPHKKHLDAHGQTFLARACARGEYDVAKTRLQERPEDINVADFAGNTPLQIAALNGYEDIVQLLIDAGCSLDCVNYDKDTPLLDAVDNGHLGVVKLLLAAGVNPRKPNAYGEEPMDRVTDETDNAVEIRQALTEAKQRMGERRRTSEEHHPQDRTDSRSSHGPESSRRSPGAGHGPSSRRAGTVRSEKTSNHLLYMPMDDRTLRAAAAKGDEETVTRILQVRESFDDPESMVAAARGGHEMVMNLLLALGGANPDPKPLDPNNEYSTPMLAAIGQENIKVVRLLLDQSNFDPTGTFKGETYHELARTRKGPNWIEEEEMLKKAYDEYRKTHKESCKTKSPSKRDHDQRSRNESKEGVPKSHKRKASSPTRETKKVNSGKPPASSPKEKRRSNSFSVNRDGQTSPKRGPGRPRKEDRIPTIAVSDHEGSPAPSKQAMKAKRTESEIAASSEGETVKPRRKLVSGRELKGEREKKQRRASLTSNASSLKEQPQSPHDLKRDEPSEKQQKSEKYHDRTKALKRDESRDRLSVSGENPAKRHRASATPPRHGSTDKDGSEAPPKRRRLDVDGKEKRQKLSSSPDDRPHKPASNREAQTSSVPPSSKQGQKPREDGERRLSMKPKKPDSAIDASHKDRDTAKQKVSDKSIHVKAEDPDVPMRDIDAPADVLQQGRPAQDKAREEEKLRNTKQDALNVVQEARKKAEERDRKRKDDEEREIKEKERHRKEEEEMKRHAEEEKRRHDEEEQRKRIEEEERKAKEEEKRRQEEEAQQKRQREAEELRRREEAERQRREEQLRKQREEEERHLREEEARKKRIEEEKRRKEEEERRKLEEEERLRREQLEREAAEEARRKREEEERRLREEAERKQREEMERRRAAREAERLAEQRRIQQEQERLRLSKLPPLLRWLDSSPNPKIAEVARKFSPMQGVRYDCIRPEATGTADGREQWLLNTQVALLLGEKDLTLSRCEFYTNLHKFECVHD